MMIENNYLILLNFLFKTMIKNNHIYKANSYGVESSLRHHLTIQQCPILSKPLEKSRGFLL